MSVSEGIDTIVPRNYCYVRRRGVYSWQSKHGWIPVGRSPHGHLELSHLVRSQAQRGQKSTAAHPGVRLLVADHQSPGDTLRVYMFMRAASCKHELCGAWVKSKASKQNMFEGIQPDYAACRSYIGRHDSRFGRALTSPGQIQSCMSIPNVNTMITPAFSPPFRSELKMLLTHVLNYLLKAIALKAHMDQSGSGMCQV